MKNLDKAVTIKTLLITVILGLVFTWGYGYNTASNIMATGGMSKFIAAIQIKTMNPLSAKGFTYYLQNSEQWQQHLTSLDHNRMVNDCDEQLRSHFGRTVITKPHTVKNGDVLLQINSRKLGKIINIRCEFEGLQIVNINGTTERIYSVN